MYAIGGLVCKLVDEKYGLAGIKQLFSAPHFYSAVENVLKIRKAELVGFLQNELAKY